MAEINNETKRRLLLIGLLAVIFGIIAFQTGTDAQNTADLKVNRSGDNMTGTLNITDNNQLRVHSITTSSSTTIVQTGSSWILNNTGGYDYELVNSQSVMRFIPSGGVNYIQNGVSIASDSKAKLKITSVFGVTSYLTINEPTSNISIDSGNLLILGAGKGIVLKSPNGNACGILLWRNDGTGIDTVSITCPTN